MKREKSRMGRPPLPPDELRSVPLQVMITAAERAHLAASAERDGLTMSDYVRRALGLLLR